MTKIRLNKFIAQSGMCSRRKADELISKGEVFVNDKIANIGTIIDDKVDSIKIGKNIIEKKESYVYYALNKPKNYISTVSDEKNRRTVIDLVPQSPKVHPVGRLDRNSEGLIILTNDGELTQKLTHPKHEHKKEYEIVVSSKNERFVDKDEIIKNFLIGLKIDGKQMCVDKIDITQIQDNDYLMKVSLHTGYNRQIRKMCDKMKLDIKKLKRTKIANLDLNSLNIRMGEYKKVLRKDIL